MKNFQKNVITLAIASLFVVGAASADINAQVTGNATDLNANVTAGAVAGASVAPISVDGRNTNTVAGGNAQNGNQTTTVGQSAQTGNQSTTVGATTVNPTVNVNAARTDITNYAKPRPAASPLPNNQAQFGTNNFHAARPSFGDATKETYETINSVWGKNMSAEQLKNYSHDVKKDDDISYVVVSSLEGGVGGAETTKVQTNLTKLVQHKVELEYLGAINLRGTPVDDSTSLVPFAQAKFTEETGVTGAIIPLCQARDTATVDGNVQNNWQFGVSPQFSMASTPGANLGTMSGLPFTFSIGSGEVIATTELMMQCHFFQSK